MLQEFGICNFPLVKYFVHVNANIPSPTYLASGMVYRLPNGFPLTDPKAKSFNVQILNERGWPAYHHFALNESQYKAYRAALTKQLVIIQGPPGNT